MKATVKAVMAAQVPPDEEDEALHEFFLYWYRFTEGSLPASGSLRTRPAVWVKFGEVAHLEAIQANYHEAKLGPTSSYTEGLIFTETYEEAEQLTRKVATLLAQDEEETLNDILKEDTLEDI